MTPRWFALLAAAALISSAAGHARAFCRTTTCDPGGCITCNEQECAEDLRDCVPCELDNAGCSTTGLDLFWGPQCVSFTVQRDGSPKRDISFQEARSAISEAFDAWTTVDCDGEAPALAMDDRGAVECNTAEYNSTQPNANIWLFRDNGWPHTGQFATLALTIITFNPETGEIYDADVEINSANVDLTVSDDDIRFDLASIVTHEAGHFIGLSHSTEPDSTMQAGYSRGTTDLRSLADDDIAGMCAMYEPDDDDRPSSCEPRHGFSGLCSVEEDSGCHFGRGSAPGRGWAPALLVALALSRRFRRARAGAIPRPRAAPHPRSEPGSGS